MKLSSGQVVSQAMNDLEIYLLNNALEWKTAFDTPSDLIHLIMREFEMDGDKYMAIESKASQICDLLFLCIFLLLSLISSVSNNEFDSFGDCLCNLDGCHRYFGRIHYPRTDRT